MLNRAKVLARHFFTTTVFLPLLSAAAKHRLNFRAGVIKIASISGITRTSQHHFKYNASKAATIQLTQLLAQELRRPGVNVRVNAISPGIFPSQMTTEGSDEQNKSEIPAGDDYGEKKGIPAGRPGAEADMAQAALYLGVNQYAFNSIRPLHSVLLIRCLMIPLERRCRWWLLTQQPLKVLQRSKSQKTIVQSFNSRKFVYTSRICLRRRGFSILGLLCFQFLGKMVSW
jgi:hypothetical protein